jgi:hypothetical protein
MTKEENAGMVRDENLAPRLQLIQESELREHLQDNLDLFEVGGHNLIAIWVDPKRSAYKITWRHGAAMQSFVHNFLEIAPGILRIF